MQTSQPLLLALALALVLAAGCCLGVASSEATASSSPVTAPADEFVSGPLTLVEHHVTSYDELPLLPGLSSGVAYGYDTKDEHFTAFPLVLLTYDLQNTFWDPRTRLNYRVPDQIAMRRTPELHQKEVVNNHYTYEHYLHEELESKWFSASLPVYYVTLGASFSKTKGYLRELFRENSRAIAYGRRSSLLYQASVWPVDGTVVRLHPNVQRHLDDLPLARDTLQEKRDYHEFIAAYGTHYCTRASLGGQVNFTVVYEKSLTNTHTESWVSKQYRLSISLMQTRIGLKAEGGSDEMAKTLEVDFQAHSINVTDSVGGSEKILVSGDWDSWMDTVVKEPTVVIDYSDFAPITDLLPFDSPRRALLADALIDFGNGVQPAAAMLAANTASPTATPSSIDAATIMANAIMSSAAASTPALAPLEPATTTTTPQLAMGTVFANPDAFLGDRALNDIIDPMTLPPLPGTKDYVGVGFDAFEEKPRLPVVQLTYRDSEDAQCERCVFAMPAFPELKYRVADQMMVTPTPASVLEDTTIVFNDVREFEQRHESRHTKKRWFGMKKKTTITVDYYRMYYQHDYALAATHQYYAWYTIDLFPPMLGDTTKLHPMFEARVNALPAEFDETAYRTFVSNFGTHYTGRAIFGGMLNATTFFHRCFLSEFSYHWVSTQSSWSVVGIFKGGHGSDVKDSRVNEKFWDDSVTTIDCTGGFPDHTGCSAAQASAWADSVKFNPVPLDYQLVPLSELIEPIDANKAAHFDRMVEKLAVEADAELERKRIEFEANNPHKPPAWCTNPPH